MGWVAGSLGEPDSHAKKAGSKLDCSNGDHKKGESLGTKLQIMHEPRPLLILVLNACLVSLDKEIHFGDCFGSLLPALFPAVLLIISAFAIAAIPKGNIFNTLTCADSTLVPSRLLTSIHVADPSWGKKFF